MVEIPWISPLIESFDGRVEAGQIPQALLIHGPEGVGRRHLAAAFASRLLHLPLPSARTGGAEDPLAIQHPDYHLLLPAEGGRQISIGQVREFNATLAGTSHAGRCKVAVICPAESLNVNAANGLLKTLEEPAGQTCIMLVTAQPGRLPATIVSRCERQAVGIPSREASLQWLRQQGSDVDWSVFMTLADGAPLLARRFHQAGAAASVGRFAESLRMLVQRRSSPLAVARAWADDDADLCLRWLYQQVMALIRVGSGIDGSAPAALAALQNRPARINMSACFTYVDQLLNTRRLQDRSLSRELQFADLLAWWFGGAGFTAR